MKTMKSFLVGVGAWMLVFGGPLVVALVATHISSLPANLNLGGIPSGAA
jgi:hypothetical protein